MKGEKWSAGQLHRVNVVGDAAVPAEIKKKKKKKTAMICILGCIFRG